MYRIVIKTINNDLLQFYSLRFHNPEPVLYSGSHIGMCSDIVSIIQICAYLAPYWQQYFRTI